MFPRPELVSKQGLDQAWVRWLVVWQFSVVENLSSGVSSDMLAVDAHTVDVGWGPKGEMGHGVRDEQLSRTHEHQGTPNLPHLVDQISDSIRTS